MRDSKKYMKASMLKWTRNKEKKKRKNKEKGDL